MAVRDTPGRAGSRGEGIRKIRPALPQSLGAMNHKRGRGPKERTREKEGRGRRTIFMSPPMYGLFGSGVLATFGRVERSGSP